MPAWSRDSTGCLVSEDSNEVQIDYCFTTVPRGPMLPFSIITPILLQITGGQQEQLRIEAAIYHDAPQVGMEWDDAYTFISEFEEICAMMKTQQLSDDAVKL